MNKSTYKGFLMKLTDKKMLFLIDGSSFLYRAYYGLKPLHTSQGVQIHAVYSFCRMIKKLIDECNPHYLALVWDSKGKTVRHEMFPEYKAGRQAPPTDIFDQKKLIQEFADLIGIEQLAIPGVEADDIMYSLAKEYTESHGGKAVFLTSDKDMGQAVNENIYFYDTFRETFYDKAAFEKRLGFAVEKMPFYYALLGDTSDNIPGVRGVGQKGALELVKQFDSLENLYARLSEVSSARTKNALEKNKANAFLSRDLFLLQYHKTNVSVDKLAFDSSEWKQALPFFQRLEFKSLIENLGFKKVDAKNILEDKKNYWQKFDFQAVTTEAELKDLCVLLETSKSFALDTETDGLDALQSNLIGISFCVKEGQAFYIPCGHTKMGQQLDRSFVLSVLKPILENTVAKKILHNAKFDALVLWNHGIDLQGILLDTYIAAQLVTHDWQQAGLKKLSEFYFKEEMLSFADVISSNGHKDFSTVPLDLAVLYAATDAHQTLKLEPIMRQLLVEQNLQEVYEKIEHPLIYVLIKMERTGILCDKTVLQQLDLEVSDAIAQTLSEINLLSGDDKINLNSSQQVADLLFEKLKLPVQKKSSKGKPSTDQEVLKALSKIHSIPRLIITYRELTKLKSTYIDALPSYINPKTNRIHTTYWQVKTATGRLASSDPNLQNIPADGNQFGKEIRSAFIPQDGNQFLSVDYSQIELRILAYLSQDTNLINAFLAGHDIHAETASRLFDVALQQVTHEQRQLGKRINFSILYGLTPYGLSKDLDISFKDAKKYIEKYFEQYPKVSSWMEEIVNFAKEHGYVKTYWGRRRYVPNIHEKNKNLYEQACRIAINTVAQGTAADLVKLGMITVSKTCDQNNFNAKILLQIHDELLLSVKNEQIGMVEKEVKLLLESIVNWNVPLIVTTRVGNNWQEVSK